jgi:hypothetical protein
MAKFTTIAIYLTGRFMQTLRRHLSLQFFTIALAAGGTAAFAQTIPSPDTTVGGRWDPAKCDASGKCETFATRYGLRRVPADAGRLGFVTDPFSVGMNRTFMAFELTSRGAAREGIQAFPWNESASETKNGGERWYALSFALPSTWPFQLQTPVTVASIDVGQLSAGLLPPLAIVVQERDVLLDMHFEQTAPDTSTGSRKLPVVVGELQPNRWYCFVIYAKWSATLNSGALKVWNNNTLVYETERLYNSYNPVYSNVPFVGLSVPAGDTGYRKIYTDMIWLGGSPGANTTHAQMRNATPCS